MRNQKYNVSLFDNNRDILAKVKSFTFEELYDYLEKESEKEFASKDELSAIVCGTFIDKKRTAKNLLCRCIITYDIDYYNHDLKQLLSYISNCLQDYSYIYYTTSSNTSETPKLRLLLFVNKEILNGEYKKVSINIAKHFLAELFKESNYRKEKKTVSSAFDKCSYSPSYLMYTPVKVNGDFKLNKNKGKLIDIKAVYCTKKESYSDEDDFALDYINYPLAITDDKVKEILSNYDCNEVDYHGWVEVLLALHHQYKGGDKGLEFFINWSLTDNNISEKGRYENGSVIDVCTYKYKNAKSNILNSITFASIIYKVNEKKRLPSEVNDWFEFEAVKPLSIFKDVKRNKEGYITKILSTYANFRIMCDYYNLKISYDIISKENVNSLNIKNQNSLLAIVISTMILNGMDKGLGALYINLMGENNQINTFKNIMDNVTWDGTDRLESFYKTIEVEEEYLEVRDLYLLKWLQQMLYLTLYDGRRKIARNLLVFQSSQKIGKSTWLMSLLPDHLSQYIGEGLELDPTSSTKMLMCFKKIFAELGELEQSFKKADINQFKAIFGRTKDELNIKYLPHPVSYTRTTSFLGTVNEINFLKDKTGSTRFLVLPVKKVNGYHGIDMLQVYKQIIETIGYIDFELNEEQSERQRVINQEFEQPDIMDEMFTNVFETEFIEGGEYMSCTEILEQIGYHKRDVKHNIRCDIANTLRKYKFDYRKNVKKWKVKLKSDKNIKSIKSNQLFNKENN